MTRTRLLLASLLVITATAKAADWPTFGHDPQRTGWAQEESMLSRENVSTLELKWTTKVKNEFRMLSALTVPVVAVGVTTLKGVRNVVYVAGSADHVFALDAETGEVLWTRSFKSYVLPKNSGYQGTFLCPNGITATPVIDRSTGILYVIAADGALYGLDLGSGKIRFGPTQFVAPFAKSWSLNLIDGVVYTTLTQGCGGGLSGFYSMEVKNLHHPVLHDLLLSKTDTAGIWGRGGPVAGKNGRIYGSTADGNFDPVSGEFSNAVIAASLHNLDLVDYYTPKNWRDLNHRDLDLGSACPVWFSWKNYNLLASGAKEGVVYLLDADALGDKDHQTTLFTTARLGNDQRTFEQHGIWGGLSICRDDEGQTWLFVPMWGPVSEAAPKFPVTNGANPHGSIMAFKVVSDRSSNKPVLDPIWVSSDFNLPDPIVIANGVVFALSTGENARQTGSTDATRMENTRPAVLYALDAQTGKVLYSSGDAIKSWVHFSGLAIAEGHVYAVDHDSQIYCFGLKGKP
jgi:outer membrane protein assembly factor BamB